MNMTTCKPLKSMLIFIVSMFIILNQKISLASITYKSIIDVYGTNDFTAEDIRKSFGKDFQKITDYIKSSQNFFYDKENVKLSNLKEKIKKGINNLGDFAYVNIDPVIYPDRNDVYFTIDVVNKKDVNRLNVFFPKPTKSLPDPDGLIIAWQEYEKAAIAKLAQRKISYTLNLNDCPAFHCLFGFGDPDLKKYQNIFDEKVPKNKEKLVEILRNDKDDDKRATAAFLLAHIKDGNELLNIMIPSIHDSNVNVRNNAMRVMGMTLITFKKENFPIDEIVKVLDYPARTDRNKAMVILQSLSLQPYYAKYIREYAADKIIIQLKMLQPNVHLPAYDILKRISNQKYAERDYSAWELWERSVSKNKITSIAIQ
jgi:hypothetical protein